MILRMRGLVKKVSFKLATPLIIASLLIAVVTWGMFSVFFEDTLQKNAVEMQARTTSAMQDSVATYVRGIANVLYNMAVDKELRESIRDLDSATHDDYSLMYSNLYYMLRDYSHFHGDVVSASAFTRGGGAVRYIQSGFSIGSQFMLRGQAAVAGMASISELTPDTYGIVLTYANDSTRPSFIHASIAIRDFFTGEYWGTVIISFDAKALTGFIQAPFDSDDSAVYNFLLLDDGALIAHPEYADGTLLELPGEESYAIPDTALVEWQIIPRTTARLVSVVDQEKLLADIRQTRKIGIIVIFAILIVSMTPLLWMIKRHVSSISKLTMAIDKVQSGDLHVSLDIRSGDEIERLAGAFNAMTTALIQADVEKERHTRMLFDSEIKALESQIDSHFISNTLNAISYSAIENGDHHTSRLLKALASTMRHTLGCTSSSVLVRDEAEWLSQYLMLQKERLGKALDYEILVDPGALDMPIHKLLIQPFVENSIVHGLINGRTGGRLAVRLRPYLDGFLWISIHDNGAGMTVLQRESIKTVFSGQKAMSSRVGVENVTTRIKNYYGPDARMFIRSRAGGGTKIDILLPVGPKSPRPEEAGYQKEED